MENISNKLFTALIIIVINGLPLMGKFQPQWFDVTFTFLTFTGIIFILMITGNKLKNFMESLSADNFND
jgi:hypothetical protein